MIKEVDCPECDGSGKVMVDRYHHDSSSHNGFSGSSDLEPCLECGGSGKRTVWVDEEEGK